MSSIVLFIPMYVSAGMGVFEVRLSPCELLPGLLRHWYIYEGCWAQGIGVYLNVVRPMVMLLRHRHWCIYRCY